MEPLGLEVDDLSLSGGGRQRVLEVTLDGDDGVTVEQVAVASQRISDYLDSSGVMGEQSYLLEVSSRGIGRPLVKPAHWRRNVGRLLSITDGTGTRTGRLLEFHDPIATVSVAGDEETFDISAVSRAVVEVEFTRKEKR
jgi:ribosome maturation factor RimP